MNSRRKLLIALGGVAISSIPALAQQAGKVWRIGYL